MSPLPPIKFQETLQSLIEASSFKSNRKPIWQAAHITSAALSQYLQGQTRPRIETLIALADFFGVSLDYLILGEDFDRTTSKSGSFNSYVDRSLFEMQAAIGAKSWMAARIGQELAEQIETTASRIAEFGSTSDGVITEHDVLKLESFSVENLIVPMTMEYNVTATSSGEYVVARFTEVVAQNLNANPTRSYDFLLPEDVPESWEESVHAMRTILANEFGVSQERLKRCRFRTTKAGLFNGVGLCKLNVSELHHNEPILYQLLSPYVTPDGWIGYAAHINNQAMNTLLYEPRALKHALSSFRRHWRESTVEL